MTKVKLPLPDGIKFIEVVSRDMLKSGLALRSVGTIRSPAVTEAVARIPTKNAQRGTLPFQFIARRAPAND